MQYYTILGCVAPAVEIGHRLKPDKIRPGSIWTKHQNMCMRHKRIKTISDRIPFLNLKYDSLMLIRKHAEHKNWNLLLEYKLEAKDIDVLNHLSPLSKLKAKEIQEIKKHLI
jgi:hypothetical protein